MCMVIADLSPNDRYTIQNLVRTDELGRILYEYSEKVKRDEELSRVETLLSVLFTREYLDAKAPMARSCYDKMKFYDEVLCFLTSLGLNAYKARSSAETYAYNLANEKAAQQAREIMEAQAKLEASSAKSVKCEVTASLGASYTAYALLDVYLDAGNNILGVGKPFTYTVKPEPPKLNGASLVQSISWLFEKHKGKSILDVVGKNGIRLLEKL